MRISDWSSDVCSSDLGEKHEHDHAHGGLLGPNTELIFALSSGAALGLGFAIEKLIVGAPTWLPFALYIAAYVFGGFYTLREVIENLRLKRFEDRKSTRLNSSHSCASRMPYSA